MVDAVQIDNLRRQCEYWLHRRLSVQNACELLSRAAAVRATGLYSCCCHFILSHYEELAHLDKDRSILLQVLTRSPTLSASTK
jgi:hypothetical protein